MLDLSVSLQICVTLLVLFLLSYGLSRLLTRLAIILALKKQIVAHPTDRSSHIVPTPRIGGIGLVAPFLILGIALHFFVQLLFVRHPPLPWHISEPWLRAWFQSVPIWGLSYVPFDKAFWLALLVGGGGMFFVGLLDDLHELKPWHKLALQCLFAVIASSLGFALTAISAPFFGEITMGGAGFLLSCVWILFAMNAYNFMDGMDGIAASFAIYVMVFLLLIFEVGGDYVSELLPLGVILIGACAGFLRYNRSPAKTFMGDCGSQFLGFFFALVALERSRYDPRAFLAIVLLMLPFLFDVTFTLIRRVLRRENLLQAHHSHLYQRLLEVGYSHKSVLAILEISFVLCGLTVYFYCKARQQSLQTLFAALALVVMFCYAAFVLYEEKLTRKASPR
jgi:UDP-GlcNAc:undecaprenyl-phosphate GlcNAc-1-phosphate transferase